MYNSQTFIATYNSTDTALVFLDTQGRRVQGINLCKYQDSGVSENIVWILLEGSITIELEFSTTNDAQIAQTIIANTIDLLHPNCEISSGGGNDNPIVPISITLVNYQELVSTNNVVAFQWYDIIDVNNQLGRGIQEVYRVFSLTTNDSNPKGIVLETNDKVIIDTIHLLITDEIDNNINSSKLNKGTLSLTNSNTIFSINNSAIIANGCNQIYSNNSTLNLTSSNNVTAINSSLTGSNIQNVVLQGVTINMTSFPDKVLRDVQIDQSNSIGKEGIDWIDLSSMLSSTIYLSYINRNHLYLKNTLVQDSIIYLRNISQGVNAEFILHIPSTVNLGGFTITVKDYNTNSILDIITTNNLGTFLSYKWDISNLSFITLNGNSQVNGEKRDLITVITNGQTSFINALSYTSIFPNNSLLIINGQVQIYGVDYTISNRKLTWISTDFSLKTTDKIYLIYE